MTTCAGSREVHQNDRTRLPRSQRTVWHLRLLRGKLQRIVESEMLPPGDKLLDYGCGAKPYRSLFSAKFALYVGADFEENENADIVVGPHGHLPCEDASIDCVLSSQVLEHTEDPQSYLKEAHRVLRTGGSLVLSAPGVWVYHPQPLDHW